MEKNDLPRVRELLNEYSLEMANKALNLAMAGDVDALRLCFEILLKLDKR